MVLHTALLCSILLCKKLELINLCFVDAFMLFCKAHIPIMQIIMNAFGHVQMLEDCRQMLEDVYDRDYILSGA